VIEMDFFDWGKLFIGAIAILGIFGAMVYGLIYDLTYSDTKITIKNKWVDVQDKEGKYLIGATSGEVFIISDTLINWRYDSSTLYNSLEVGMTCHLRTSGWRFPLFSNYRNILKAECS
jgi:hypothetical protein